MALIRRLQIPQEHYSGLRHLLSLTDEQAEGLTAALSQTPPTLLPDSFATRASPRVESLPANVVHEMIRVLHSLYATRASMEVSLSDFVDALREAIDNIGEKPADGDWDAFKKRLEALLSLEHSLGVLSKAFSLWTDYERAFADVQVVTDIRPVFKTDPEDTPVAALVIHQLKISYKQDNEIRDFFVAITSDDLRKIRNLLNRADVKAKSLTSLLEQASVQVLQEGGK